MRNSFIALLYYGKKLIEMPLISEQNSYNKPFLILVLHRKLLRLIENQMKLNQLK